MHSLNFEITRHRLIRLQVEDMLEQRDSAYDEDKFQGHKS